MATISSTLTLVDNMTSKLNTIRDAVEEVETSLQGISGEQASLDKFSWSGFLANAEAAGKEMAKIGKQMSLAVTAPLTVLGKKMYDNATDYESAFAGVKKTTDATQEEYDRLYSDLLEISERTPTGFVEGAGIMEMAGQLGVGKVNEFGEDISEQYRVATEDLTKFTEAYIGLQESTNIQGESGAADLARFLNVTERTTANVDRVAGVIVGLGNNFATTENEILAMATRMGATADLAGFTSPEILAFSAALSSVGINAEAGGSAAGKLMKQMQLAAEVGGKAQAQLEAVGQQWESGIDFSNYLAGIKKADLVALAESMGTTTDAVQSMADSWVLLDQFSDVMGLDQPEFLQSWDEGAATSMLRFFQGLGNLDETTGNSVLAQLAEMDLNEIRESNLIAAMAGNSELFAAALTEAYRQYELDPAKNAMAEEVAKRYATQESQNAMLGNKLDNTMADFGQNLVEALQPALDLVNDLLDKFNSLSETDQTALVDTLGAIAVLGPSLTLVGNGINAIGNIGKFVSKLPEWGTNLANFFNGPAGWVALATTALAGLVVYIESIPTELDNIIEKAAGIRISFDDTSVKESLSQIQQIQSALDILNGNKATEDARLTSESVKMGWGTTDMFNTGLAYESAVAGMNIEQISNDYAAKILELQDKIKHSQDSAQNALWFAEIQELQLARDVDISAAQDSYSMAISDLFNGMAKQYPEAAKQLETAAQQYDLLAGFKQLQDYPDMFDYLPDGWGKMSLEEQVAFENQFNAPQKALEESMITQAANLGYLDMSAEEALRMLNYGTPWTTLMYEVQEQVAQDLTTAAENMDGNPLADFLATILQSDTVTENLDFSQIQGAFDGMIELLDFTQAAQKAVEAGNPKSFGEYLNIGLAEGITDSTNIPVSSATTSGTKVISALQAALGENSPSVYTQEQGMNLDVGLAMGITENVGAVITAINAVGANAIGATAAVCNQLVATANSIMNYGAGFSMGYNVAAGMAAGVNSGAGAVVEAVRSMVTRAIAAGNEAGEIHSPSRLTYWSGSMLVQGYVNSLNDGRKTLDKAAADLVSYTESAWNAAAWSDIALFAGLEHDSLLDDAKDAVKISDSDIRKIRDLAEREVINRFTTAKVEIEMHNTNEIKSNMDLDGIADYLGDKVSERLEAVAEGVYA